LEKLLLNLLLKLLDLSQDLLKLLNLRLELLLEFLYPSLDILKQLTQTAAMVEESGR